MLTGRRLLEKEIKLQVSTAALQIAWKASEASQCTFLVVELPVPPQLTGCPLPVNNTVMWLYDVRSVCKQASYHLVLLDSEHPDRLLDFAPLALVRSGFLRSCWAFFQMCFKPRSSETVLVLHKWTPDCDRGMIYPKTQEYVSYHLLPRQAS